MPASRLKSAVLVSALLLQAPMHAVTPVSPALTEAARTALLEGLARAAFPEVGRNSVLIALTSVLGFEPRDNTVDYDQPYPQLPKITARARRISAACAEVELVARYAAPGMPSRTRLRGTYCLAEQGRWSAGEQRLD